LFFFGVGAPGGPTFLTG